MAEHVAAQFFNELRQRIAFEDVVQTLRLIVEEFTMTVPEILDMTDGLLDSMQEVVDGAYYLII